MTYPGYTRTAQDQAQAQAQAQGQPSHCVSITLTPQHGALLSMLKPAQTPATAEV